MPAQSNNGSGLSSAQLSGTQAGLSIFSTFSGDQSEKQSKDAIAAALPQQYATGQRNYGRQLAQGYLQAADGNTQTTAARNDRLSQYRQQMGSLRVAQAAQGSRGASASAQARSVAGSAGTDIQRLTRNNERQRSAITSNLFDARTQLRINNETAYDTAKAQTDGGGFLSTFLSIAGTAAGAYFGGPQGAAIGAQVGGQAGNALE